MRRASILLVLVITLLCSYAAAETVRASPRRLFPVNTCPYPSEEFDYDRRLEFTALGPAATVTISRSNDGDDEISGPRSPDHSVRRVVVLTKEAYDRAARVAPDDDPSNSCYISHGPRPPTPWVDWTKVYPWDIAFEETFGPSSATARSWQRRLAFLHSPDGLVLDNGTRSLGGQRITRDLVKASYRIEGLRKDTRYVLYLEWYADGFVERDHSVQLDLEVDTEPGLLPASCGSVTGVIDEDLAWDGFGVEVRSGSLATDGTNIGAVWSAYDPAVGFERIYFRRFAADGTPQTAPIALSSTGRAIEHALAWMGSGFAVAWTEEQSLGGAPVLTTRVVRPDGSLTAYRLIDVTDDFAIAGANSVFAVAFVTASGLLNVIPFDSGNFQTGSTLRVDVPAGGTNPYNVNPGAPSVTAYGWRDYHTNRRSDFLVGWREAKTTGERALFYTRLSFSESNIGRPCTPSFEPFCNAEGPMTQHRLDLGSFDVGIVDRPAVAWNETGIGVAFVNAAGGTDNVYFATFDTQGNPLGAPQWLGTDYWVSRPTVTAAGPARGFGIGWSQYSSATLGLASASPFGRIVSTSSANGVNPSLVWTGTDFRLSSESWSDQDVLLRFGCACDDTDGDGICGYLDNCPSLATLDRADADGDGIGNGCDDDKDGDDVPDAADNCLYAPNPTLADADGDGIGDACDRCPGRPDPALPDSDGNGTIDICQARARFAVDTDGDGKYSNDNCPSVSNPDQQDDDDDGVGAACDCNDQNASVYPGAVENCGDGRDDDCNSLTDVADPVCSTYTANQLGFQTGSKTTLAWTAPGVSSHALYRGPLGANGMRAYTHSCYASELPSPQAVDSEIPRPGEGFYYLATGLAAPAGPDEMRAGSVGLASSGAQRPEAAYALCGAVVRVDPYSMEPAPDGSAWSRCYRTIEQALTHTRARNRGLELWLRDGNYEPMELTLSPQLWPSIRFLGGFFAIETLQWQRANVPRGTQLYGIRGRSAVSAVDTHLVFDRIDLANASDGIVSRATRGPLLLSAKDLWLHGIGAGAVTFDGRGASRFDLVTSHVDPDAGDVRVRGGNISAALPLSGHVSGNVFDGATLIVEGWDGHLALDITENQFLNAKGLLWLNSNTRSASASNRSVFASNLIQGATHAGLLIDAADAGGSSTLSASTTPLVANNTIVDGAAAGVFVRSYRTGAGTAAITCNPSLWDNLVVFNGGDGVGVFSGDPASPATPVLWGNDLFGNSTVYNSSAGPLNTAAQVNALPGNASNWQLDPLFAAPSRYRLSGGSPALDRATTGRADWHRVRLDVEGNTRPRDGNADRRPDYDTGASEACGPAIVVSQVYGGGGSAGATYKSDFIELYNRGTISLSLTGWSVQYAPASGGGWQVTQLAGTIQPGGYLLVKEASGTAGTLVLPAPDVIGVINLSPTAGKVALVAATTALNGTCPSGLIDLVGYGAANCFEGTGPAPGLSPATAVVRKTAGCMDADVNSGDFVVSGATPRNTSAPTSACGFCP